MKRLGIMAARRVLARIEKLYRLLNALPRTSPRRKKVEEKIREYADQYQAWEESVKQMKKIGTTEDRRGRGRK